MIILWTLNDMNFYPLDYIPYLSFFIYRVRKFFIYILCVYENNPSKFQLYNSALSAIISMLAIRSQTLFIL